MKRILLASTMMLLPSVVFAQCTGVFSSGQVCGNPLGSSAPPRATTVGALPGFFANPTGTVGLTTVNGVLTTALRSDAAPPLSQAITPLWTGLHTFTLAGSSAILVRSGASGSNTNLAVGRTSSEGFVGVAAGNSEFMAGTVAGDFALIANTNMWLGSNAVGASKPGIKIDTSGLLTAPQYGLGLLHSSVAGLITSSLVVSADLNITTTTCTNQFVRAISATGVGTCSSPTDAEIPLTNTHILVGNVSNAAVDVALSGDAIISNTGVLTIANAAVTYAKIQDIAALSVVGRSVNSSGVGGGIAGTASQFLVVNAAGSTLTFSTMAGDATLSGPTITLASVISAGGPTGSATVAPIITYDAKGRLTTVSSATITPAVGSITGLGTNVATWLATPSSANLAAAITDETGTGVLVFGTAPTFTTSITVPLLIGGTGTTGTQLTFQTTTGNGTTDAFMWNRGNNGATTAMTLNNSGLGIGTTAPGMLLHVAANDSTSGYIIERASTDGGSPAMESRKSRGTLASPTIVASGDNVGDFTFRAYDGGAYRRLAQITSTVDGTPGASDMPGRLGFWTVLDGTITNTLRMSIFNDGGVIIGSGTTSPGAGVLSIATVNNASTTAALCWNSGTGVITENGAVGTCTVSLLAAKNLLRPLTDKEGFDIVMAMEPWRYTMKEGLPTWVAGEQIGFIADYAEKIEIAKPVVVHNHDGALGGFRYEQYTAALTAAFKYLKADNDNLREAFVTCLDAQDNTLRLRDDCVRAISRIKRRASR